MTTYTLLGTVEEINICDCCGKKNLKHTIALETEDGSVVYFGSDCAGKALYGRKTRKNGEIALGAARAAQKCRDALPIVLAAIKAGDCPRKALKDNRYSVDFGRYADTGRKMPLRIYWNGYSKPGVTIPAEGY